MIIFGTICYQKFINRSVAKYRNKHFFLFYSFITQIVRTPREGTAGCTLYLKSCNYFHPIVSDPKFSFGLKILPLDLLLTVSVDGHYLLCQCRCSSRVSTMSHIADCVRINPNNWIQSQSQSYVQFLSKDLQIILDCGSTNSEKTQECFFLWITSSTFTRFILVNTASKISSEDVLEYCAYIRVSHTTI